MKNVLRKLLGGVAPVLASALGGPLAGTAVRVLAEKLGIDPDKMNGNPEDLDAEVIGKIEKATAADWLAIKQAEQNFLIEMRKLDISEVQIDAMDRDSARKRQIALGDKFPNVLASLMVSAFIGVLGCLFAALFYKIPLETSLRSLLDVCLGILLAQLNQIYNYYFGSSSGSKEKTQILGSK